MSFYSGFAEVYERVFPFREEVYRFLRAHAGEPGGKVLDVGCGPGHYCGRFAGDGYQATGVDLDEAMIAQAVQHYCGARFLCLDMRDMKAAGSGYRCIYSIGNVMAHLDRDDLVRFLGTVHAMLDGGGVWIMQVMNWDALSGMREYEFPSKTIEREAATATFSRRYDFTGPDAVTFSISISQGGEALFEDRMTLYPVSTETYLHLHESAGFRFTESGADFVGSPLRREPGSGLVMAFRKA
jgi:SAM-dependent methyltransferase